MWMIHRLSLTDVACVVFVSFLSTVCILASGSGIVVDESLRRRRIEQLQQEYDEEKKKKSEQEQKLPTTSNTISTKDSSVPIQNHRESERLKSLRASDYNPLAGPSSSGGYKPTRRKPPGGGCGGGGCGRWLSLKDIVQVKWIEFFFSLTFIIDSIVSSRNGRKAWTERWRKIIKSSGGALIQWISFLPSSLDCEGEEYVTNTHQPTSMTTRKRRSRRMTFYVNWKRWKGGKTSQQNINDNKGFPPNFLPPFFFRSSQCLQMGDDHLVPFSREDPRGIRRDVNFSLFSGNEGKKDGEKWMRRSPWHSISTVHRERGLTGRKIERSSIFFLPFISERRETESSLFLLPNWRETGDRYFFLLTTELDDIPSPCPKG